MTEQTSAPDAATDAPKDAYQQIDSLKVTRNQKSLIGLVVMGNLSEFFDLFLIGFVVALLVKPWELSGFEAGVILACSGLGTVLGAIIWGRLADRIGRRRAFMWCVLIFVGGTALTLVTPDRGWLFLAFLRVLVGIGVGGLNITSIPYVQEFVPSKQRGLLSGLGSAFIPLGLLLGSLAQLAVGDNWRMLIALGIIPILLLIWLKAVPESPRYFQSRGQDDRARESLAWAMMVPVDKVLPLPPLPETSKASYHTVLTKYRKSLIVITVGSFCFMMGGFAVQSWGQTILGSAYELSPGTVALLFVIVSLADLAGRLSSAYLSDRIGRRWTMFSFGMIGAFGCVIAALGYNNLVIFFIGIVIIMAFGDGAFGILNAFGAEQFPTSARSTGLGLGYGIGATAKIIGPWMMGLLIGGSIVKQDVTLDILTPSFLFFGACFAVGSCVYLLARETRGVQLDQA